MTLNVEIYKVLQIIESLQTMIFKFLALLQVQVIVFVRFGAQERLNLDTTCHTLELATILKKIMRLSEQFSFRQTMDHQAKFGW